MTEAAKPDGRVAVLGRMSDLVITGGENVWPHAVEAAIAAHPSVSEVAVGGRPDPEWGERGVAWVVPTPPNSYPATFTSGPYAGFSGQVTDYLITSEVRGDNGTRSRLTQILRQVQVPLFQFGVFYGAGVDLEIAPGPNMTFNGRVHSNSNIYVGAGSTLDFDSTITTAGGILRRIRQRGEE